MADMINNVVNVNGRCVYSSSIDLEAFANSCPCCFGYGFGGMDFGFMPLNSCCSGGNSIFSSLGFGLGMAGANWLLGKIWNC